MHSSKGPHMEVTEAVLATMKENGAPMSAGQIATATGIDRKESDKAIKKRQDDGSIVSPVRSKWEPAEK